METDTIVKMGGEGDRGDGEEKVEVEGKEGKEGKDGKGDKIEKTRHRSCIDILSDTLMWGHLAPTAPDTLACYPFTTTDPFVLGDVPDVLFAGKCV